MKSLMPLIVLALVVAGFAYYTLFAGPGVVPVVTEPTTPAPVTSPVPDQQQRQSFTGEGSMYSLLTRGDNLECAITYIPNPLESALSGNIFTFDGNLRGDFVVPTPDLSGEMVTSIIIADSTIWQWTDINGEVVGSKQTATFDTTTLQRLVAPIGLDSQVQYSCLTWPQVDYTIFETPASVLFTDTQTTTFEEGTIYVEEGEF